MVKLVAYLACLISSVVLAGEKTCTTQMFCIRPEGVPPTSPCPDPKQHHNPVLVPSEPQVLNDTMSKGLFQEICPYMDVDSPLCCNSDQVAIMNANFQQIDSVFGQDVPMCGLNQKKQWCEYTCSPRQSDFVQAADPPYIQVDDFNFTSVHIWVDEDYACTQFQSCQKVSLIASASIQSAMSFLDFIAVNGENQSLTIMDFTFDPLSPNATAPKKDYGSCSSVERTQRRLESLEEAIAVGDPMPLDTQVYPCDYPVPDNGTVDGYDKLDNATCNYCQAICDPPDVNGDIAFMDGFDNNLCLIVAGSVAGFSIIWQLYVCARARKIDDEISSLGLKDKLNAQQRSQQIHLHSSGYSADGIGNSASNTNENSKDGVAATKMS